jgi:hypothetical protein
MKATTLSRHPRPPLLPRRQWSAVVASLGERVGLARFRSSPSRDALWRHPRQSHSRKHLGYLAPAIYFAAHYSSEASLPFMLFLGGCIAETFIYTWLFNGSGGSVPVCMVFHSATNLALALMPVFPDRQGGKLLPYLLFTTVEALIALTAVLVTRRRQRTARLANIAEQGSSTLVKQGRSAPVV